MRLPNYLETKSNNRIGSSIGFKRFPYEMMFKLIGFKLWLYPKFIIGYFKKIKNVIFEVNYVPTTN